MEKRYQVFISSTFEDLKDERQAVLKAILELDHIPAGMELFPASDITAWSLICDVIDMSDYYTLIVGGRYGSMDEEGIGYTEKEYDYAIMKKKPVIALLHAKPDEISRGRTEIDETSWGKLKEFRKKVEKSHTCRYWETPGDLMSQIIIGLTAAFKRCPAEGWVRAGSITSEEASHEIIKLQKLVNQQKEELEHVASTPPQGSEFLAQGDDTIFVDCKLSYSKENSKYSDPERVRRVKTSVEFTWNELFNSLASVLINPTPESKMKSVLQRVLREKLDSTWHEMYSNYKLTHVTVAETFFQTIKVQFLALGLIDSHLKSNTSLKKEKDVPMCELTNLGKKHLINLTAIRRD